VSEWSEDDIKAELRALTQKLRRVREELRGMVSPPKLNPARPLLRRKASPSASRNAPVAEAADKNEKRPKKRDRK
jgi:hypothetical protein